MLLETIVSQQDPARTVQIFIDLIQRHEQSFYNFVHKVHSKGEDLFSNLMHWVELFLTLMRDGLGENISLEFLLPHTGQERADIVKEVDAIALYHYKLKVAYEDKVRRRFGRTQGLNDADAENEIAAEVVNGVVRDLSFGELIQGDADDIAAQETDSDWDSSDDEDDGSESGSSEDDSDGSDESDSNESQQTERETLPQRQITPVTRSHTIGYLPHPPRSHQDPKSIHHRQSLDPHLDRPPLPLRPSRSLTLSHPNSPSRSSRPPPLPSRDKDLPPPPPLKSKLPRLGPPRPRSLSVDMKRNDLPKPSPLRKKKNTVALKPPELIHLPRLLPVFLEMVRYLYAYNFDSARLTYNR